MPCFIGCAALIAPRLTILVMVIFGDYIGQAYQTLFWPLLGFFFMPLTTLAYAWAINSHGSVSGLPLAIVVIAVLIDLGIIGSGASSSKKHRKACVRVFK